MIYHNLQNRDKNPILQKIWEQTLQHKVIIWKICQNKLKKKRNYAYLLLFGVCQYVRFEVGGLRKLLVASVEWTNVGSIPGVDSDVSSKIEVQRKTLPTTLKRALERFLPGMDQLEKQTFINEWGIFHRNWELPKY